MTLPFAPPAGGLRGIPVCSGIPAGPADLVVFGAPHGTPYEGTDNTPFAAAPAAIRTGVSLYADWIDHWDFDVGGPILGDGPFAPFDAGDLPTTPLDGAGNRALIRAATASIVAKGAVPIMLGGDDSTPIPFLDGFAGHGPLCVVQVDSHIDWRDERHGERHGFSSTMRRASEMGHVAHIVQIGMRAFGSARAAEVEDARRWGAVLVTAREVHRLGIEAALAHVPAGARCVITVDCDGLDPAIMPAVMALTPGGLTYTQAIDLIAGVAAKARIAGFAIVEFVPARDPSGIAAITAGRLAVNALGHVARRHYTLAPADASCSASTPPMTPPSPHRPVLLVALLSVISFGAYALRTNIAIAQEFMMPELGLRPEDMGTISAWGFQLAYALFQIPAGFLGDRYGSRKVLTWAVVGWALASFGTGLVPATAGAGLAFASLFAMRFALGVAQAATYPVGVLAVSQAIDPRRRGAANGIFISSAMLGAAVAPPAIAWTMVALGWRAAFFASGALALAIAIVWFVFTPVRDLPAADGPPRAVRPLSEQIRGAAVLLRDRPLLLLCLSYAAHSAVFFVFVFWFFRYLTDARGFSVLKGGVFGAAPYLAAAVIGPTGGWLLDRLCRRFTASVGRRTVAIGGLLLAALFVALGANAEDPYLAIAALSLSVGCLNAVENPFWITATHLGAGHAGAAGGVLNFMGNMGGVVSIWAVPRMVTAWGWTPTLATWAGVAVVSALLWLTFAPERPREI